MNQPANPSSTPGDVHYPDGLPTAESDAHRKEMQRYLIEVLQGRYADRDVYVSGKQPRLLGRGGSAAEAAAEIERLRAELARRGAPR